MEDHHVDRKRVEVWQHMKLSFTNSSFGLILSLVNGHLLKSALRAFEKISWFALTLERACGFSSAGARKSARRPLGLAKPKGFGKGPNHQKNKTDQFYNLSALRRPGGSSGEPPPDPIPNSAVKLPSANGTAS